MKTPHFEIDWPRFAHFFIGTAPYNRTFVTLTLFWVKVSFYLGGNTS